MTGSGTSASPFQAAGLSIVTAGTPAAGDSFLIQPTAAAASGFSVLLTTPSQIAAASLVQGTAGTTNTGTGAVSSASITDPSSWSSGTYKVTFTGANAYKVTDGSGATVVTGTYSSGSPISFNGAQLTLTGAPAAGDTFTLAPNSAGNTGDNSNLFAMIDALSGKGLDGGTTSVAAAANNLVSQIGVVTQQAQNNAAAQKTVNQDATTARNNASGVNLDQEAATMLRFQQAYGAMAQVISTSKQMFQSLISAVANG
jgi:flagellar hook-associated protein 1 FlgK